MENQRKCSNKKHSELNAVNYCNICNLYLCNKCSNMHRELLILIKYIIWQRIIIKKYSQDYTNKAIIRKV